jgi:hypothetical protein
MAKIPAEIGTYHLATVKGKDRKKYSSFMRGFDTGRLGDMNDWILVYEGKADIRRYHELLVAIYTVIRLLYDADEKAGFIGDLITKHLPPINKKTAQRLAKDLQFRGF